jgi:hypothetical protein
VAALQSVPVEPADRERECERGEAGGGQPGRGALAAQVHGDPRVGAAIEQERAERDGAEQRERPREQRAEAGAGRLADS